MKTTLLALALALSSLTAGAQGTIFIANDIGRLFVVSGYGPIPNGPLPTGHVIVLALYAGTNAGSLSLRTSYAVTGANWLTAGRTATKGMTLWDIPRYGGPAFFNIVLTDNGAILPSTIDGALFPGTQITPSLPPIELAGADYYGSSGLFQMTPSGDFGFPAALNGAGTTWPTGNINIGRVPEPSCMALFGLGTGVVMLFRRRK